MQGLRALAVTLVVAYHVWFGRVSGGVDVFFLISGFLVTGALSRSAEAGTLRFRSTWARQAVRLVPSAAVVLVASAVAGMVLLPEARWLQTLRETVASAFFLENWRLAVDSIDYAAQHNTQSIVQHFWSLSIQVQFYIVWPLLVAVVAAVAGRAYGRLRLGLFLTLVGVGVASLTFSITLTISNQPLAYFHSLTRGWEFALGGLLALVIDALAPPMRVRIVLGWTGVVALVACGALLDVDAVFPGFVALWPTLAASLVLIAGTTGSTLAADHLLGSRPVRYLGDLSYCLYLWHWPVLILYLALRDQVAVGLRGGLAVVAMSVLLAVLTHHLVEEPLRRLKLSDARRFGLCGGLISVVLVTSLCWSLLLHARAADNAWLGDPNHPGAAALASGSSGDADLLPPLVDAPQDFASVTSWDCRPMDHLPSNPTCSSPLPGPAVLPAKRIVVVGDSHAAQFLAALGPVAADRNWQIISMTLGGCAFSAPPPDGSMSQTCVDFNQAALAEISELRPDAVFTLASHDVRPGLTESTPPGFVAQWQRLADLGIPVIAARDNPRHDPGYNPADCLEHRRADGACGFERAEVYPAQPSYLSAVGVPPTVSFIDTADLLCNAELCPAEVGNVLVYMDFNHVSATYMTSLAPLLGPRLDALLR
ncbi:acyltransferase family protein [Pseudonocardia kujensis]|uniref:acyltransferase family protein n=1 Tax=Pseudonocardia kujensis TaxID=1128675 RepID=UPI0022B7DF69